LPICCSLIGGLSCDFKGEEVIGTTEGIGRARMVLSYKSSHKHTTQKNAY
jgi:hypothetical protein